jgi:hypothetical protein
MGKAFRSTRSTGMSVGHIVQRHDQLEEQWSFFVKKCVPDPTTATS